MDTDNKNIAISVSNLSKSYKKLQALDNINFNVEEGEIFGVIGPDGAGKTTLFRILTTLLLPDRGKANVAGFDIVEDFKQIRKNVGYMPGRFSLYQDMSVEENLNFFATVFGVTTKENYHLVSDIYSQLEPFKDRRAGKLSGGMKQKLALCCALIHKPKVLFLDEPTTGVDPVSRTEFWQMLKKLKQSGLAILVSTPYMDEAALCDRIAFIKDGVFFKLDTPEKITENFQDVLWSVSCNKISYALNDMRNFDKTKSCFAFGSELHITFKEDISAEKIVKYLNDKNYTDISVKIIKASLEDCFIAETSKN